MINNAKPRIRSAKSNGWTSGATLDVIEQLVRFAAAAQIPVGGGAFGVLNEFLSIANSVKDNASTCKKLLKTLSDYSETIWEFIQAVDPASLVKAGDLKCQIAKKAVLCFCRHVCEVKDVLQDHLETSRFRRVIFHGSIRQSIEDCNDRIASSHTRFQDAVSNVIVTCVSRPLQVSGWRQATFSSAAPFNIMGARVLYPSDVQILNSVVVRSGNGFWSDASIALVTLQKRLMKVYYEKTGGRSAFIRDITRLAKNSRSNLPIPFGYCEESTPPFVVLTVGSIMPYQEHILKLAMEQPRDTAILETWKMLYDMKDAASFLIENNECVGWHTMAITLKDGQVDEHGKIILAPEWRSWEEDTEDDSELLKYHLDRFIQLHAYTLRECQPLTALWHAFHGNYDATLAERPSDYSDPACLMEDLRELWPPGSERAVSWPQGVVGQPALGDVGIFARGKDGKPVWRKLCNVCDEMGGPQVELEGGFDFEVMQDGVFRVEILPGEDFQLYEEEYMSDDCHPWGPIFKDDLVEEDCVPEDDFYGHNSEFEPSMTADTSSYTEYTTSAAGEFGCTWVKRLRHWETQWEFMLNNAKSIAAQFHVQAEELVLVTETTWYMCTEGIDPEAPPDQPVYLFIHLDEAEEPRCYWTFSREPLSRDDAAAEQQIMLRVGCLEPVLDYEDPMYLQLDESDLTK